MNTVQNQKMMRSLVVTLALTSCSTMTLEDHLKITSEIADFSTAKHLCVKSGKQIASVDITDSCIKLNKPKMKRTAGRWGIDAVKGLWLHEIGHIKQIRAGKFTNIHRFTHVDIKKLELEADEYAGCQMKIQKLDHTKLINFLRNKYLPNSEHGSLEQRVEAIQRGYERC